MVEHTLDHDDLQRVLATVRHLYAVPSPEALPATLLRNLRDLVPSDSATFNEVDPVRHRSLTLSDPVEIPIGPGRTRAELEPMFARLAADHPVVQHISATGDGSASTIDDFLTDEQFHATDLYQQVYRWMGVEQQLSVTLPAVLPRIVAIVLSRDGSYPRFSARDRAVMNCLRPHLSQAYQLAIDAQHVQRMLETSARILESDGRGVVVLDGGLPHDLTPGAMVQLYRFFGRPGRQDALPPRVRRWLDHEQREPDPAGGPGAALRRPLVATADGRRLTVRLVPSGPLQALSLSVEDIDGTDAALRATGLTDREATVVRHLADGLTNIEIARRMGVAAGTVKTHLDNCYRKLGVRNRAQAVAVAFDLLGHASSSQPDES